MLAADENIGALMGDAGMTEAAAAAGTTPAMIGFAANLTVSSE